MTRISWTDPSGRPDQRTVPTDLLDEWTNYLRFTHATNIKTKRY